ncbi:carbohydrate kinase family protein [Aestuariivirga sp.]|uniref:carbohydrate kinase family protein n=1 Tax=Aestuariivirga sp. TaxID=2650926 RepID=UPI0035939C67
MAKVIVIGGANVDIKGRARSAFVGGTSNPGDVVVSVGGVGRNIAENLVRLGLQVSLLSVLGNDSNGLLVRETTKSAGVDLSLTLTGPAATGTYLVILNRRGELQSAVNDMQNIEWLRPKHLEAVADQLSLADILVADCNIDASCLEWLCTFSARSGVRLVIEPVSVPKARKLLAFRRSKPIFAITPNKQQLEAMTGQKHLRGAIRELHALGFENVVVHRGAKGAVASSPAGQFDVIAPGALNIADVTGAGDAAVAGLIVGILEGMTLWQAATLGQAAAAIKLASLDSVSSELSRDRLKRIIGF